MLRHINWAFVAVGYLEQWLVLLSTVLNTNKDSKELSKRTPSLIYFGNCPLLPSSLQQQADLFPAAACSAQKAFSWDFGCLPLQMY